MKKKKNDSWLWQVFIITFCLAMMFGAISNTVVTKLNIWVATILLFIIIFSFFGQELFLLYIPSTPHISITRPVHGPGRAGFGPGPSFDLYLYGLSKPGPARLNGAKLMPKPVQLKKVLSKTRPSPII